MVKYSQNFNRDYEFYLNSIKHFKFCGTFTPRFEAIPADDGVSAKEAFFFIDSNGVNKPTSEPELLNALLLCKASINFQIKEWAQARAEGTLPYGEFAGNAGTFNWVKTKQGARKVHAKNIKELYKLPQWVVDAVEAQKYKYYDNKTSQG